MGESKIKVVGVALTPALVKEIDQQAEREGLIHGRSAIVRKACMQYLHRHKRDHSESIIVDSGDKSE